MLCLPCSWAHLFLLVLLSSPDSAASPSSFFYHHFFFLVSYFSLREPMFDTREAPSETNRAVPPRYDRLSRTVPLPPLPCLLFENEPPAFLHYKSDLVVSQYPSLRDPHLPPLAFSTFSSELCRIFVFLDPHFSPSPIVSLFPLRGSPPPHSVQVCHSPQIPPFPPPFVLFSSPTVTGYPLSCFSR